ncbi:unnamed protein product [Chilo suppressalis]|uniref:Fatty acyl-CoA reductase n=1 Tax=Chilo suppressalis TaxID=168631 RepID=A0ABN8B5C3_CHISP|nr:unnamed protein product [Chilo suppressalis]
MAPSVSVKEYYAGKSLFITGSTGFMGKVLVEKILRSCPDVKCLYVLMRSKKGHSSKERIDEFLNCKVFDYLNSEYPEQLQKLRVVPGDILVEDLGMSIDDREMLQKECHVVLHCAACVRFDMFLRDAVNFNTVGTQRVLDLASGMTKLEVFVHVSTAYTHCDLEVLEDKMYPSKHKPHQIMNCVSWMDDKLLEHLQPKLIEPQPNTYSYTKALAEDLVAQYAEKFPIVITRPSIVVASYKEPMPGWVDNLNGPTGFVVGCGKGVTRTMHCDDSLHPDMIPVDMVVNACILLAYTTALEKSKELKVCNLTLSDDNPITWKEVLAFGLHHVKEVPSSVCLWYPGGSPRSSWLRHQVALFFTLILPAYFVDLIMILLRKKTFMVNVQKRIRYGMECMRYFTTKEWHFKNDNLRALRQKVSPEDNKTFFTDMKVINWNSYLRVYVKGVRKYILKEDPSTLPQARRLQRQLYYADMVVKYLFYSLLTYLFYSLVCENVHLVVINR